MNKGFKELSPIASNVSLLLVIILSMMQYACKTKPSTADNTLMATQDDPRNFPIVTADSLRWDSNIFDYENLPRMISNLNVNVNLNNQAIRDTFNTLLDQFMISEMELDPFELLVSVEKTDRASLEFSERDILIILPLKINIEKETFLKRLKASGELEVSFITSIDIDSSWNLQTQTKLSDYQWIEKPRLDLGFVQIPFEKIASNLIEKSKSDLEQQIDQAIKEEFSLRASILRILKYVEEPIPLDEKLTAWVQVQAQKVFLTGSTNTQDWTKLRINTYGTSSLSSEKPDSIIPGLELPEFNWASSLLETSHLKIYLDLSYEKLDGLLKSNFKNKKIEGDGKELFIHDISLRDNKEKLQIEAFVSGDFDGSIIIEGVPVYDSATNEFYADDLSISIKTKNVLQKAAAWMLKGKIKSKLQELSRFSIEKELNDLQNMVDRQIAKFINEDELDLDVKLDKFRVEQFLPDGNRIYALVDLEMFIELNVYGVNTGDGKRIFILKD